MGWPYNPTENMRRRDYPPPPNLAELTRLVLDGVKYILLTAVKGILR
jgi:hypothetical protein